MLDTELRKENSLYINKVGGGVNTQIHKRIELLTAVETRGCIKKLNYVCARYEDISVNTVTCETGGRET